jgi:hypothetical protein
VANHSERRKLYGPNARNTRDLCARIRGRLSQKHSGSANCNIIHQKSKVWKCHRTSTSSTFQTTRLFGRGYSRCLQSKARRSTLASSSPKPTKSQRRASLPHSQAMVRLERINGNRSCRERPGATCRAREQPEVARRSGSSWEHQKPTGSGCERLQFTEK